MWWRCIQIGNPLQTEVVVICKTGRSGRKREQAPSFFLYSPGRAPRNFDVEGLLFGIATDSVGSIVSIRHASSSARSQGKCRH